MDQELLARAIHDAELFDVRLSELLWALEKPKRAATRGQRVRLRAAIDNLRELRGWLDEQKEN